MLNTGAHRQGSFQHCSFLPILFIKFETSHDVAKQIAGEVFILFETICFPA